MREIKKRKAPHNLPSTQRYLFECVGRALEHANAHVTLSHADHLRVLELYRELITEDWITTQPDMIPHISKLLGKG